MSPEALAACDGKPEGDGCSADGASGKCIGGACASVVCGNNRLDPGEVCDDGNLLFGDGCNPTCNSDETCGNGFVDPNEGCDCGAPNLESAQCSMPNSDAAAAECRPDCTPHNCGDGVIENSEQCEGTNLSEETCTTLGYYKGTLSCDQACRFSGCSERCGDGTLNGPELCEIGRPLVGQTCLTYGYDAGRIACAESVCRPGFDACRDVGWIEYLLDSRGFQAIWGSSAQDVWAGGQGGGLLHWDGAQWSPQTAFSSMNGTVTAIWGTGPTDVYAHIDSTIHRFNGTTWSSFATLPDSSAGAGEAFRPTSVSGVGTTVIAVNDYGDIATKTGAGAWVTTNYNSEYLTTVYVVSSSLAYAAGIVPATGGGYLIKWNGSTWSPVAMPTLSQSFNTIYARSDTDVYVGTDTAMLHWDGTHWSTVSPGTAGGARAIYGTSTHIFVAFAGADIIGQFDGTTWTLHEPELARPVNAFWAATNSDVFAATGSRVARYAGSATTIRQPEDRITLHGTGGEPGGPMLAVGDGGFVLANTAGVWRHVPSSLSTRLYAVSGNVVVGELGSLGTFDGTRIVERVSGTSATLWAVWAASATNAWAVGENGVIVHFNGTSATLENSGTNVPLNAVWGLSANDVYAVGILGTVLRRTGSSWAPFVPSPPAGASLNGVWGTSDSNLFVTGIYQSRAYMAQWNGTSWVEMSPTTNTGIGLGSVYGISATEIYAAEDDTDGGLWMWRQGNGWDKVVATGVTGVSGRDTVVLATGRDMTMMSRVSVQQWQHEMSPDATFPTAFQTVYAAAANDVYAVRISELHHFDGFHWSRVETGLDTIDDVAGAGSDDVWVTSNNSEVSHWNGMAWTTPATLSGLTEILEIAVAPGKAWVIGPNGASRYFFNGQWLNVANVTSALHDVTVTAGGAAFAVGTAAAVYEWGGLANGWMPISPSGVSSNTTFHAAWAASAADLFVGGTAVIARRTNGTWTTWDVPGIKVNEMHGTSANDVFAVGEAGTVLHFDGIAWSPVRTDTAHDFDAVSTYRPTGMTASTTWYGPELRGLRRDVAW